MITFRVLLVDDDEDVIQDYREELRAQGHRVDWVNTLAQALHFIHGERAAAEPFDLVLIDLMLNCEMPMELKPHFDALARKHQNEGQSLGRWLWLEGGRRKDSKWPAHCYFSSVTAHYAEWSDKQGREFEGLGASAGNAPPIQAGAPPFNQLVLSKWSVKPDALSKELEKIMALWAAAFPRFSAP